MSLTIPLSEPIECTPKVNPKACSLVVTRGPLGEGADSGGGGASVKAGGMWGISVPSPQFFSHKCSFYH